MKNTKRAKKRVATKPKRKPVKKRVATKPKSKPVKTRAATKPKSKPAAPASREKCDELVDQLGRAIVGDEGLQPEGWTHLVLQVRYYSETHNRIGGWCYLASDDFEAVAPDGDEVKHTFTALRHEMAKVDQKKPWKVCLLRLGACRGKPGYG